MNIWILNTSHEIIGSLSNDSTLSCPFWNDLQIQKLTDFDSNYTFTVPCNHDESNLLIAGNMIVVPDLDGDLILYRITQVEDGILDSTSGAHTKVVTCLDQYIFDLVNTFVSPQTFTNGLGRDIFNHILEGTGWVVNREEYIGSISTFTIEDNTTAQAAMQAFVRSSTASDPNSGLDATDITNFVCEPKFYIKMAGGQITDYCVDLFVQRGEDTGKRFEYKKDITGVTRTEDINNLYTALKLVGGTDTDKKYTDTDVLDADGNPTTITVRSVNNHLDYVYDDVANELYNPGGTGYLMGVATNSTITEPQALLNWGNNKLKQFNHPRYTYTVDVVMLEDYGFTAEQVRLGDNVRVLDLSMNPPLVLEARVIEMDISYSDPSQNKVVLGDYIELSLGETPSAIEALINRAQSTADTALSTAQGASSTAAQAASDASDAKQNAQDAKDIALKSASGGNYNYYGSDTPTTPKDGDLWFKDNSDGSVTIYQWDGTTWQDIVDQGVKDAKQAAADAQAAADNAAQVAAEAQAAGDNAAKVAADAQAAGDNAAQVAADAQTTANNASQAAANAQATGDAAQQAANDAAQAASDAQSKADAAQQVGQQAQQSATDAANYAASAQQAAQQAAQAAQKSGTGNLIYRQSTQPTGVASGDLWFDTANGNRVSIWDGSTWVLSPFGNMAVANLDAGSITTGYLAANLIEAKTIDASKLVAGTITASSGVIGSLDASKITTGTLDASQVTVTNLDASKIVTGTLDANKVTIGNLSASIIQTGTLDANKVTIANLSANSITSGTIDASKITVGNINANNITTGTIDASKIVVTNLDASKIITGTLDASKITVANINASKITTGYIAASLIQVGTLDANVLKAGSITVASGVIGSLDANTIITGTIDASKITVNNLNANNIKSGAINSIDIIGSKFKSSDSSTSMVISGGNIQLTQSNGDYVQINPAGLYGYYSGGSQKFKADASLVTSAAFGTNIANVYMVATGEARVITYGSLSTGTGAVSSYTYLPLRADGFYGNYFDATTNAQNIYVRPYSNGNLKVTGTGTTSSYRPVQASTVIVTAVDINTDGTNAAHIYIRPTSSGEVKATQTGSTTSFVPVRASSFPTGSLADYKQDISEWTDSIWDTVKNTTMYQYKLKLDVENGVDKTRYGFVIGGGYNTPPDMLMDPTQEGVEQYLINAATYKWSQEAIARIEALESKVADLEQKLGAA